MTLVSLRELVGFSVRFVQPADQMLFKSSWLDQSATLGNKATYPTILAMCDDLLGDLNLRIGTADKIRACCCAISQILRPLMPQPGFWTSTPVRCGASFGSKAFHSADCATS
jgi:hypothetical protein